ncbi:MAG: hypothetical protein N3A69_08985, partial [Leptospiraceae bacterium]|nr:hypothetical protein [Leptospiraceae bacterium]
VYKRQALLRLLARLSGWEKIAFVYQVLDFSSDLETKKFITGRIGNIQYTNSLHVYLNEFGIGLKTVSFYKLTHPPIFIPWQRIRIIDIDENQSSNLATFEVLGNEGESIARISISINLLQNYRPFLIYT